MGNGTILVTGATGNTSGATIHHLVAGGAKVRALVHTESKAEGLKSTGVEIVVGDFTQPDTLDKAFKDVSKVFLLTPGDPDAVSMASNAIAAAKRAGNPHIVRQSGTTPPPVESTLLGRQHAETEEELKASGLPYTIIQPTFFMQNTMMAGQTVASDGVVYMPFKDGKVGIIDLRDVGEAAAKILTSDGHEGKTYVLTGPASIGFNDIAAGLSTVLGKEVKYIDVPPETGKEAMLGMGMTEFLTDSYSELLEGLSNNTADFTTADFETLTGHTARTYEDFARDFAQAFGGG